MPGPNTAVGVPFRFWLTTRYWAPGRFPEILKAGIHVPSNRARPWVSDDGIANPDRTAVETSFREIKALRFGLGMSALRICRPERRDRLLLLSALAIALLPLLGADGEALGYDRWLKAKTVKRRTHSLFRQGLMLHDHIAIWPEERLRPLLEKFAELLLEQRLFRNVFSVI